MTNKVKGNAIIAFGILAIIIEVCSPLYTDRSCLGYPNVNKILQYPIYILIILFGFRILSKKKITKQPD